MFHNHIIPNFLIWTTENTVACDTSVATILLWSEDEKDGGKLESSKSARTVVLPCLIRLLISQPKRSSSRGTPLHTTATTRTLHITESLLKKRVGFQLVKKSPTAYTAPLVLVLSQINPDHYFLPYFFRTNFHILDFKLPPCSGSYILSFGWLPGVWILYADVSEHSVYSIFIGGVSRKKFLPTYTTNEEGTEGSETSAYKIQTPGDHPKEIMQNLRIVLPSTLRSSK